MRLCSDLLLHQDATFVRLLLVRLVDLVPLRLVKTGQPVAERSVKQGQSERRAGGEGSWT